MLHSITDWLGDLPLGSLYVAIAALSAFENFFPPFPSDAVIAFGSFLADRAHGSPSTVFFLGSIGNPAGSTATYTLGRPFCANALLHGTDKSSAPDPQDR